MAARIGVDKLRISLTVTDVDDEGRCNMRALFLALALILAACVTPVATTRFSYSSAESLGVSPMLVLVAPGQAITAAGSVDLRSTNGEQRSAAALAALGRAQAYAEANRLTITAPPLIVNRSVTAERWDFDVMLPVDANASAIAAVDVSLQSTPEGVALALDHAGSVADLNVSYQRLVAEKPDGVRLLALTWEQYLTDPTQTPPAEQRTRVFRSAERR
jgi:effector-binding domain-containing protein